VLVVRIQAVSFDLARYRGRRLFVCGIDALLFVGRFACRGMRLVRGVGDPGVGRWRASAGFRAMFFLCLQSASGAFFVHRTGDAAIGDLWGCNVGSPQVSCSGLRGAVVRRVPAICRWTVCPSHGVSGLSRATVRWFMSSLSCAGRSSRHDVVAEPYCGRRDGSCLSSSAVRWWSVVGMGLSACGWGLRTPELRFRGAFVVVRGAGPLDTLIRFSAWTVPLVMPLLVSLLLCCAM